MTERLDEAAAGESVEVPLLTSPADGVPSVVDSDAALRAAIDALGAGTGPIAVDAERAQGYRYDARAWLVQLRRAGSGTHLIDPAAFADGDRLADLSELGAAIADAPWVIHAASQDLACLAEVGLRPRELFDTELAARLLNYPRVGLGPVVEQHFGVHLLKEHSAADWSRRPLPQDWLTYAALDVELLVELRERLLAELADAGKADWAAQEFAAEIRDFSAPHEARVDPWRRVNGLSHVRSPAGFAVARELWTERDELARRLDRGPGRVLPDAAITTAAAMVNPSTRSFPTRDDLRGIDGFKRRIARRFEANWLAAIDRVREMPRSAYPPRHAPHDGVPRQPRSWERSHPEAYARWLRARDAIDEVAAAHDLPRENLLSPAVLRAVAWEPPAEALDAVTTRLIAEGARRWQAELSAAAIAGALADPTAPEAPVSPAPAEPASEPAPQAAVVPEAATPEAPASRAAAPDATLA